MMMTIGKMMMMIRKIMMMIRKMMMVTTTVTKECKRGLCHHSVTLLLS